MAMSEYERMGRLEEISYTARRAALATSFVFLLTGHILTILRAFTCAFLSLTHLELQSLITRDCMKYGMLCVEVGGGES